MPAVTALAIDVGGSHVTCAVVRGPTILGRETLPADGRGTLGGLLPAMAAALRRVLAAAEVSSNDCAGVVMGFCGIVNPRQNRVFATNEKFDDAASLDLVTWCAREFSLPFFLENDARLALLGEQAFGAAGGADDAVMITLGTGIGASAMLNGRLLQSRNGLAGMIGGHLPVVLEGRLCSCGNRGCAESEAATAFLDHVFAQHGGTPPPPGDGRQSSGFAELFDSAARGDGTALAVLDHCMRVWSVLTVALIHAYDPEVVVLGGSVMKRADDILPRLQTYVRQHAWTPGRTVPLRAAVLGSDSALLGAIPLIESRI